MSFSHRRITLLVPVILSSTVHSSYMGQQYTCAATVSCLFYIYSLIVHIPAVSSASDIGGHSQSLLVICCAVIPVIILAAQLWKPYITFSMSPITTQLSLLYSNTN